MWQVYYFLKVFGRPAISDLPTSVIIIRILVQPEIVYLRRYWKWDNPYSGI